MKRKFDKAELKSHNLEININFLDDYGNDAILFEDPHDDDGEFAWEIKVEKVE
jgi:hypothetical protein